MIKKILNFLISIYESPISINKPQIRQSKKYKKYDNAIYEFELKKQLNNSPEHREQNYRKEILSYIKKDAQKVLAKNIEEFNNFLNKYGLEFDEPCLDESKIYPFLGHHKLLNLKLTNYPHIVARCRSVNLYIKIEFDPNDKTIYEDFKNDKLKITYDLVKYDSSKSKQINNIISSNNFDDLEKAFVDYYIRVLSNKRAY